MGTYFCLGHTQQEREFKLNKDELQVFSVIFSPPTPNITIVVTSDSQAESSLSTPIAVT